MKRKKKSNQSHFGKALKSIAEEKGLSMRELAKIAGVSTSTINDWQSGAAPENYLAVKKMADSLGVSFTFLLTGQREQASLTPTISDVLEAGEEVFNGFAKITIQRMIVRKDQNE